MNKKKSIVRRLIPWLILLVLLAGLYYLGTLLYGKKETEVVNPPVISYYEGGKEPLVMENDSLRFELDPTNTQFVLTEKKTGREWRSNPENAASDPIAISTNKALLQSTMVVTYSSSNGIIDFNNYQFAIENGTYTIDQLEDGAIRVNYVVGKIEKIYILPQAITPERYKQFTGEMKSKDSKKVSSVYTLYKPEKIATADNHDELVALYPSLDEQELYVLKADTSENNKKNIAALFEAAGYTEEDYENDMQLVAGSKENTEPVFNVSIVYRLDGDDFLVQVPYSEMRYRPEYPITAVTVLPMFGAAGVDEEGFMLIPEGGGALIHYNNGKLNQNSYYANMYGWDWGSERTEVVSETKNTFPVFGLTKNGGSFLCMMEGPASFGGVQADISQRYNSYNWVCAKYTVIHSDKYNVSAKTARLVYMFEKELPDETIQQRYRFIDSDSYNDMAHVYGDYLRDTYPELTATDASEEMPVTVELVGAIDKTVVKFGMPVDSVVATTTFDQAKSIIDDLQGKGVKGLNVRMSGWSNGGVQQKVLTSVRVVREMGGENGLKQLVQYAKDKNIPLYFDGISTFAYRSGMLQGFIPFRDAARFTTREQIIVYPYSSIWYQQDDSLDAFYLVQPSFAKKAASNLINALNKYGAYGVAFRDIGYLLSGDYNPNETTTREQVKRQNVETIAEAKAAGEHVMIKEGYDWAMPYVDIITDMDLAGMEYSIIDERIPFYQMAIHGAVDYTGMTINIADDWETEMLRCAEYGAGLNFTFMAADAKVLQDTFHSNYYGAGYDAWAKDAADMITAYQTQMAGLNRQRMVGHNHPAEQVSATTYEDGTVVYVNYRMEPFTVNGTEIPARSYLVVKEGSK